MAISEEVQLKDNVSKGAKDAAGAVTDLIGKFEELKKNLDAIADAYGKVEDSKKGAVGGKGDEPGPGGGGGGGGGKGEEGKSWFDGAWLGKIASITEEVTALGNALKSLGPAGEMGGAVISTIGEIGTAAFHAASKISSAFGKILGFKPSGGGGGEEGGGGGEGGGKGGGNPEAAAAEAAAESMANVKAQIGEMVSAISDMMLEMVHAVISGTMEFIKVGMEIAIEASSARGDTEEIFGKIMGEEADASAKYEELAKIGRDTGAGQTKAIDSFRKLVTSGFKEDQATKIVQAAFDIDAVRGGGAGQRLNMLMNRIKASGSMKQADVKMAAKQLGLSEDQLIKDMAAKLGKSESALKGELKKGIKGDDGIDAILGTVEKRYGGMASKLAESIPETLNAIKAQVINLFDKVNLKPLEEALHTIKDALDGELGAELKANMTELFSAIFEALFGEAAKSGDKIRAAMKGVSDFIKDMAGAVKAVTPLLHAFVKGIMDGVNAMAGGKSKGGIFDSVKENLPTLIPLFTNAGKALVSLFSMLATFAGWMTKIVYGIIGIGIAIGGALASVGGLERIGEVVKGIGIAIAVVAAVAAAPLLLVTALIGGIVYVAITVARAIYDQFMLVWEVFDTGTTLIAQFVASFMSEFESVTETLAGVLSTVQDTVSEWVQAGYDMIGGLIEGIESNAAGVAAAVIAACINAVEAAKKILGIASPSKVFEEIGGYTAEGMEGGIDDGAAGVAGAAKRMGAAAVTAAGQGQAAAGTALAGGAAGGRGGDGAAVHIEHLVIHANDSAGGKAAADAFEQRLNDKFRRLRRQG